MLGVAKLCVEHTHTHTYSSCGFCTPYRLCRQKWDSPTRRVRTARDVFLVNTKLHIGYIYIYIEYVESVRCQITVASIYFERSGFPIKVKHLTHRLEPHLSITAQRQTRWQHQHHIDERKRLSMLSALIHTQIGRDPKTLSRVLCSAQTRTFAFNNHISVVHGAASTRARTTMHLSV